MRDLGSNGSIMRERKHFGWRKNESGLGLIGPNETIRLELNKPNSPKTRLVSLSPEIIQSFKSSFFPGLNQAQRLRPVMINSHQI